MLLSASAAAEGVVRLEPGGGRYELGSFLDLLEDPDGTLTIDDVTASESAHRFERNDTETLSRGMSASAFWLRFVVEEQQADPRPHWLLDFGRPIYFFEIELYTPSAQGWSMKPMGAEYAPRPSYVQGDAMLLDLPPVGSGPVTVYVRIVATSSMFTPMAIYADDGFLTKSRTSMLWIGGYIGILLALVFYNLILFFALRDRIHLLYILYVGSVGLYAIGIDGITFEYIFPAAPEVARRFTLAMLGIKAVATVSFTRLFLATREHLPRADRVLIGQGILSAIFVLMVPFAPIAVLNRAISGWGYIILPTMIAVCARSMRGGVRHVRFYILALIFFFVALAIYGGTYLGFLPFTWAGYYGFQVASAVEAVLLAFALAERIQVLRLERERLVVSEKHYQEQSRTDALTGLANRRCLDEEMPRLIREAESQHQPLTVLMLDVDNFKRFNDTYGHQPGDELLVRLGEVIRQSTRGADMPFRYGGEEFVVALPNTPLERAEMVAERIRTTFASEIMQPKPGTAERATVSLGVAAHITGERARKLITRADEAMYQAKQSGKNRTVLASAPAMPA